MSTCTPTAWLSESTRRARGAGAAPRRRVLGARRAAATLHLPPGAEDESTTNEVYYYSAMIIPVFLLATRRVLLESYYQYPIKRIALSVIALKNIVIDAFSKTCRLCCGKFAGRDIEKIKLI